VKDCQDLISHLQGSTSLIQIKRVKSHLKDLKKQLKGTPLAHLAKALVSVA
jgi:hypothetical protein